MKFNLKSKARYSLLLLALGGGFGQLVAQQNNTKTTTPTPGSTLPSNVNRTASPNFDTIKPPGGTNPNSRALPNSGNPADTMRTKSQLPPEGRTMRRDSMPNNQGNVPNQGLPPTPPGTRMTPPPPPPPPQGSMPNQTAPPPPPQGTMPAPRTTTPNQTTPRGTSGTAPGMMHDSTGRHMMPSDGGKMPNDHTKTTGQGMSRDTSYHRMSHDKNGMAPGQKMQRDSTNKRMMPNDGRSGMKPQQGTQLDSTSRTTTMDKTKTSSGTKPKATTMKKKKSAKAKTSTSTQGTTKGTTPSSTTTTKPKTSGGN